MSNERNELYDFNIGHSTAYAYAKASGDLPEGMTPDEYGELLAAYATVGQTAVDAKDVAVAAKTAAETAATTATNKASEATTAAQTATTKAGEASQSASQASASAQTASTKASEASQSASTATEKATEATTAAATATSAKTDAVAANTAAQSAKTAAQTAQTGAETAAASVQSSAAQIATNTDDIAQLKSDLTTLAPKEDMLKAFPTDTASGIVASFADGANVPVKSLIVNIDPVQSGSGDPSPTNVRPISGWSEVNVEHTGANIWDEEWEVGSIDPLTGQNTTSTSHIRSKNYIPVKGGNSYNLHMPWAMMFYYDANKTFLRSGANGATEDGAVHDVTLAVASDVSYIRFRCTGSYGITYGNNISINYPSTDHDYHPYNGQSINIALGQTVYGGKLDVVSGELVIDRAGVDLGTLEWADNGTDSVYTTMLTNKLIGGDNCVCSALAKVAQGTQVNSMSDATFKTYANGVYVAVKLSGITMQNAQTMLSGFQFVYPLAASLTIQLAPNEVRSLLGDNNVWADSGDSEVVYRADPTLYIGRLTEPDADMVADANITSGQYFMVGNTLYKATTNIASGGAITPNVNCTRKSLSEALNELNV